MNQAELEVALVEVNTSLVKVGAEIDAFKTSAAQDTVMLQAAITALEAELAAGGPVTPAVESLVSELRALSVALDFKIDDLPAALPSAVT